MELSLMTTDPNSITGIELRVIPQLMPVCVTLCQSQSVQLKEIRNDVISQWICALTEKGVESQVQL